MSRTSITNSVAGRFSAAATTYDRHAKVQSTAAAGLLKLLGPRPDARTILEIGCGTGLLTSRLATRYPAATICATDISAGMIEQARERTGTSGNVNWVAADFRTLSAPGKFDLILSSSTLHWITPLEKTFAKAARLLSPDGLFAFSLMLTGTLCELHKARAKAAPSKPVAAPLPTRTGVRQCLQRAGFRILRNQHETRQYSFKSASTVLKALHEQGVTGGPFAPASSPLTRGELSRLVSYYDSHYTCRGGVSVTYEIMYVVASR